MAGDDTRTQYPEVAGAPLQSWMGGNKGRDTGSPHSAFREIGN